MRGRKARVSKNKQLLPHVNTSWIEPYHDDADKKRMMAMMMVRATNTASSRTDGGNSLRHLAPAAHIVAVMMITDYDTIGRIITVSGLALLLIIVIATLRINM